MRGSSASARVLMVEAHKGQLYLLPEHRPAKFQRIDNDGLTRRITGPTTSNDREQDTGLHHAVAPSVTRDETRNTFDEDRLTFGEAGSSSEAKRWHSTVRSREYRRRCFICCLSTGRRSSSASITTASRDGLRARRSWANNYGTTLPPVRAVWRFEDRRQGHGRDGGGRR